METSTRLATALLAAQRDDHAVALEALRNALGDPTLPESTRKAIEAAIENPTLAAIQFAHDDYLEA